MHKGLPAGCDFLQRAFWGLSNKSPFISARTPHIFVSLSTSLAITTTERSIYVFHITHALSLAQSRTVSGDRARTPDTFIWRPPRETEKLLRRRGGVSQSRKTETKPRLRRAKNSKLKTQSLLSKHHTMETIHSIAKFGVNWAQKQSTWIAPNYFWDGIQVRLIKLSNIIKSGGALFH